MQGIMARSTLQNNAIVNEFKCVQIWSLYLAKTTLLSLIWSVYKFDHSTLQNQRYCHEFEVCTNVMILPYTNNDVVVDFKCVQIWSLYLAKPTHVRQMEIRKRPPLCPDYAIRAIPRQAWACVSSGVGSDPSARIASGVGSEQAWAWYCALATKVYKHRPTRVGWVLGLWPERFKISLSEAILIRFSQQIASSANAIT